MSFFAELRRRNVFKVAAAYAVVGWLIIQVVSALSGPLNLPEWFETVVVVLLAIGLPLALLFAWAFDLTADGIKLTQPGDAAGKAADASKLDYALVGGLVVVAVVTLWGRFPSASVNELPQPTDIVETPSIAVLPFADMSPDGDQEYFGDGIAEELLNELTQLDGLRVAGRTSSFSFKQSDEDLQTIGDALRVNSILEGSIRKDGDRIRITAQLINAADGYHIWSETYDRELTDIFAVQEEIAASVAGALGVRLGVGGINDFRGAGTSNVEAYEIYLRGLLQPSRSAGGLFERAIQLDPNYAAAWAQLGLAKAATMWIVLPEEASALLDDALPLVRHAIELDPGSARAHSLMGTILYARLDWIGGEEAHAKALSFLSDRPTLDQHANLLMRTGRSAAARTQYDAAESVEPLDGRPEALRINVSLAQGRIAEAKEIAAWDDRERQRRDADMHIALNEGEPEALKTIMSVLPVSVISTTALYSPVLSVFDSPEMVLTTLRAVYADENTQWPSKLHDIALLAAYFGDPEFALQVKAEEVRNTPVRLFALWYPVMSEVRQLPEFKQLVTDINLVAYWRAYGWADACRPLGDDDFTCS